MYEHRQVFDCWLRPGISPEAFVTACRADFLLMLDRHWGPGHGASLEAMVSWPERPAPDGDGWLEGTLIGRASMDDGLAEALYECLERPFLRLCSSFQASPGDPEHGILRWRTFEGEAAWRADAAADAT